MKFRTLVWYGFVGSLGFILGNFVVNAVYTLIAVGLHLLLNGPVGPTI